MKPNIVSYSAVIMDCAEDKDIGRAFDVCADMLRQAMKPNMVSHSALVSACAKSQDIRRAFEFCADMRLNDMKPHMVTKQCADQCLREGQGHT